MYCALRIVSFPNLMRRVVADRLNIKPDEITAGHCVALSLPRELADILRATRPQQADV